jgi:2-dehydropantoate 2-reductase
LDVLIIGAGAVGSLVAFWLGAAGHRVTAIARESYIHAYHQRGLLVEQEGRALRAKNLTVVDGTASLQGRHFDLVLITTKVFDTAVAAVQARPFVIRGARTLVLQNGVGGIEIASGILGDKGLYAGVLTMLVEVLKPAVIRPHWAHGGLGIAAADPDGDPADLVSLLTAEGIDARSYADWQAMKWSKLMLNLIANAIPAILDERVDQVYGDRRLYDLERAALCEARTVVNKMNIRLVTLPGYRVPFLVWAMCALPAGLTYPIFERVVVERRGKRLPSLHHDLTSGRTDSEVEYLNGAVVRAGERLDIPTPVNDMLCRTLVRIARGEVEWALFKGQAQQLIRRAQANPPV